MKKVPVRVCLEIEEEKVERSRAEAAEILDKLLKAGKCGPIELAISPNDENIVMLNRRVHALERIADRYKKKKKKE